VAEFAPSVKPNRRNGIGSADDWAFALTAPATMRRLNTPT
jgi:hypothetical protein